MLSLKQIYTSLFCALVGMLCTAVGAQTDYQMSYQLDTSNAYTFDIHFQRNNQWTSFDVYASPFTARFVGTVPNGYTANPFSVYCVDLDHYDSSPATVFVKSFSTRSTPSGNEPAQ